MPSFSTSLRSSTSTSRSNSLPSFFACWPSQVGVQWLPGRLPNSRAMRHAGGDRRAAAQAVLHRLALRPCWQSSVTTSAPSARRRARLGVAVEIGRRRRQRRPRPRRAPSPSAAGAGQAMPTCLRAARLERAEAVRGGGLERPSASRRRRRDDDHARGRDAGRPMQIEQLALLQRQVAFADGVGDQRRQRRGERRDRRRSADDENERIDVEVRQGPPARRSDA